MGSSHARAGRDRGARPSTPAEQIRYWLVEERRRLLAAIAGLDAAALGEAMRAGGWSVREVLAHRLFWERREVEALGQFLLGRRVELLEFPLRRVEAANAAAVRAMRGRTTEAILRDLETTRALLLELVERAPDADLNAAGNAARVLLGVALHHDREHRVEMDAWRAAREAAGAETTRAAARGAAGEEKRG